MGLTINALTHTFVLSDNLLGVAFYTNQYILWMYVGSFITILKTLMQNWEHVEDWSVSTGELQFYVRTG